MSKRSLHWFQRQTRLSSEAEPPDVLSPPVEVPVLAVRVVLPLGVTLSVLVLVPVLVVVPPPLLDVEGADEALVIVEGAGVLSLLDCTPASAVVVLDMAAG